MFKKKQQNYIYIGIGVVALIGIYLLWRSVNVEPTVVDDPNEYTCEEAYSEMKKIQSEDSTTKLRTINIVKMNKDVIAEIIGKVEVDGTKLIIDLNENNEFTKLLKPNLEQIVLAEDAAYSYGGQCVEVTDGKKETVLFDGEIKTNSGRNDYIIYAWEEIDSVLRLMEEKDKTYSVIEAHFEIAK